MQSGLFLCWRKRDALPRRWENLFRAKLNFEMTGPGQSGMNSVSVLLLRRGRMEFIVMMHTSPAFLACQTEISWVRPGRFPR